jgi:hypothetical protein
MIYLLSEAVRGARAMKGSDKWGEGSGPRVELVLAALVVVSILGVYFFYLEGSGLSSGNQTGVITTVSTTGIACGSNSMPQTAQQVEQDPTFTNLSGGLCYNYIGESLGALTFAYYNGMITYPCGDAPLKLPASEILVNVSAAQSVTSAQLLNASEIALQNESCDPSIPMKVVAVQDVESTIPAVPQLNLTLTVPLGGRSVANLQAVLTLNGGSQTFKFGSVSSTDPLTSPMSISSTEIILSNLSFNANQVYPMTISGTFADGQAFSNQVRVQIAQVP